MSLIRGYLAMSLDGFIAGPNDEIAWLEEPRASGLPLASGEWADAERAGLEFADFLAGVGCILMGRRTYDVVRSFEDGWPYGEIPMLVLTSRPLADAPPSVTAVAGPIEDAVAAARAVAGDRDVYVDGGATVRAALDAGLLEHLIVTIVPTAIGDGIPLFTGLEAPAEFTVERVARWGDGLVQLHLTTREAPEAT